MRLQDYAPRPARRHQNGRRPLNLVHAEQAAFPLEMETAVGRAGSWNTLRALRVLRWYGGNARWRDGFCYL